MQKWNKEKIVDQIIKRQKNNLPLSSRRVQEDDKPLYMAAITHWQSWQKAIEGSGFCYNDISLQKKWSKSRIVSEIITLYKNDIPLNYKKVEKSHNPLLRAATKRFKSWDEALIKAGFDPHDIRLVSVYDIQDMRKSARLRNGTCLSKTYKNVDTKLKWQCANGHKWESTPMCVVIMKTWCPYCSVYTREERCRYIFNGLSGKSFIKDRAVLKNRQELDGYCKDLHLAFEYHGKQHYELCPFFHRKNALFFKKQKELDKKKKKRCQELGIDLIVVPYFILDKREELKFISDKLKEKNISIKKIDINHFTIVSNKLNTCQAHAKKKGGKLIDEVYINNETKMQWGCHKGHCWLATWSSIQTGKWCPYCHGNARKNINEILKLAQQRGFKLLTTNYINNNTKMRWQCSNKHTWKATYYSIKKGNGCPSCAGNKKKTIEEMQQIAKEKGGKCLSERYINSGTHLRWQCSCGNEWMAVPSSIVSQNIWCPKCGYKKAADKNRKYSIEDIQRIAQKYNCRCLSNSYKNNWIYMEWQCHCGHIWQSTFANFRRRQCQVCKKASKAAIKLGKQ